MKCIKCGKQTIFNKETNIWYCENCDVISNSDKFIVYTKKSVDEKLENVPIINNDVNIKITDNINTEIKHITNNIENKTKNTTDKAIKYDFFKIRYDLVPKDCLEKFAEVYTHGSFKYADENWRKGMEWKRMYGSMERHFTASQRGEDIDPESGCLHLMMVAWYCFSLVNYLKNDIGIDNRVKDLTDPELICKGNFEKQLTMFWDIIKELQKKGIKK